MSKYGHIKRVTIETSKGELTFRSKFEYHWSVYLELLERQGIIIDWKYESEDWLFEFQHGPYNNTRKYLPDFAVQNPDGSWEIHEIKGVFKPIDYTKCKKFAEAHDEPLILIFENLTNCKSSGAAFRRAERISKHINRVIYDARKTILIPIKHLFEV